ncbi:MAG: C1 family peptidase [Bacteroidales bacterium]|nr:C1 family peptidase [Bacteroidales bacterium]
MKRIVLSILALGMSCSLMAQNGAGGLTANDLNKIKTTYEKNGNTNKALSKIIANNDIRKLAINPNNKLNANGEFSNRVPNKGITDQKQSGRCWMFSGFNVLRNKMIQEYNLGAFELSQNYLFFYDQLEKSNLFLSLIIKHKNEPLTSKDNEWLLKNVLSDGGTFCGVVDLVTKYGVVPSTVVPETYNSNNTSRIDNLITLKLKEDALELRSMKGNTENRKIEMLAEIYKMLVMAYGEPITEFTYTLKDKDGNVIANNEKFTPKSFYDRFIGIDLVNTYVMLMNDPSREYYKLYEIENDRHTMDGHNWQFINLPADDIKTCAINSIKDSTLMYFSCDVGKSLDNEAGTLDLNNFDYETLFGVKFGMDKKQRIETFASGSSHAMTLVAVDIDPVTDKPTKWMVENSWGASSGYQGHLIMTDDWFNEYMFRLVVDKKYVPQNILDILKQKPIMLPPWDPMFSNED